MPCREPMRGMGGVEAPRRPALRSRTEIVPSRRRPPSAPRELARPEALRPARPAAQTTGSVGPSPESSAAKTSSAAGVDDGEARRTRLGHPAIPASSADVVATPASGSPRACASARAVETPIRRPVNEPGPDPDRDRSIRGPAAGRSDRLLDRAEQHRAVQRGGRRRPAGRGLSTGSRAAGHRDRRVRRGGVEAEDHRRHSTSTARADRRRRGRGAPQRRDRAKLARGELGPLDERDRVGRQVVVEQARVLAREAAEPVEVEVGDGNVARVAVPDREGRRGDRLAHAERPRGAADEGRLARAELAADEHDVAGLEPRGQLAGERLGGLGPVGLAPSCSPQEVKKSS